MGNLWDYDVNTAADLMQDLKSECLSLSPAKSMFVGQLVGTAMGCVIASSHFDVELIYLYCLQSWYADNPYKATYTVIYTKNGHFESGRLVCRSPDFEP